MEFPEREEDIVEFALRIAEWLEQHPDAFPGIPFSAAELRSSVDTFNAAQAASVDADCSTVHSRWKYPHGSQYSSWSIRGQIHDGETVVCYT
jgi:hypothetical protein